MSVCPPPRAGFFPPAEEPLREDSRSPGPEWVWGGVCVGGSPPSSRLSRGCPR